MKGDELPILLLGSLIQRENQSAEAAQQECARANLSAHYPDGSIAP